MKYGSVCSGVEAASLAWHPLGWECKFVSEVEPFPCAVLQERFGASAPINPLDPAEATDKKDRKTRESWIKQNEYLKKEGVLPNEGDFTKIGKKYAGQIDLLVGGTPCQDLSVAGKRAGFEGERSSLALDFVRLAYESQCKWFVWENVPGVFSSNNGRDFATLLSLFTGSKVEVPKDGWRTAGFFCNARRDRFGVAWRTLDGQFTRTQSFPFAVPQRRRRVFLVGYFGDWTRAAQVLLEPSRLQWNNPPRVKTRKEIAEIVGTNAYLATRTLQSDKADGGIGITIGCDVYNSSLTGDVSKKLNSAATDADHVPNVIESADNFINFASSSLGGYVESETSGVLRSAGGDIGGGSENIVCSNVRNGNEQIVCGAFLGQMGAKAHGIGYEEEIAKTLDATVPNPTKNQGCNVIINAVAIAIAENIIGRKVENGGNGVGAQEELAYTQNATGVMGVCTSTVRRLLPIECERLMGFPDNWTRIPWKGKSAEECPDSPRYKACGNSFCVNVVQWIGEQIERIERKYKNGSN